MSLIDGNWHRLHPATPLLKGGIALIAILGIVIVNLRDVLIELVIGGSGRSGGEGELLTWIVENGLLGLALLAITVGLLLFITGLYLSWRMHSFRITDEVVEVRSGILFRTNRKGRLDRIQGINIVRPFFARLFGAAKLEVNVAGQDANVQLSYLSSVNADALRGEILRLASGTQAAVAAPTGQGGTLIEKRVAELLAPERDPDAAPPQSVVTMHLGRLIGSLVLSSFTVVLVLVIVGAIVGAASTGDLRFLAGFIIPIIGMGGYYISKFTRSLRYSIAGTPDGVRVGFGLLSTSNETLPPGRIHSVQVNQPLLWRAAGWWEIKINRASTSSASGAAGQANTTILPVGNLTDARRVLELVLPGMVDEESILLLERGLLSSGGDDGFVNSPRRAAAIRWFSWRRNGFVITPEAVLLRRGAIWRQLVIVPEARIQSVAIHQGPLLRLLGLASLRVHTVAGPIEAELGAVDREAAVRFFGDLADAAVASGNTDTSHHWRSPGATA